LGRFWGGRKVQVATLSFLTVSSFEHGQKEEREVLCCPQLGGKGPRDPQGSSKMPGTAASSFSLISLKKVLPNTMEIDPYSQGFGISVRKDKTLPLLNYKNRGTKRNHRPLSLQ
jgi:hypothetical protein